MACWAVGWLGVSSSRPRGDGRDSAVSTTRPQPALATSTLGLGSLGVAISVIGHRTCASELGSVGAPSEVGLARQKARIITAHRQSPAFMQP